MNKNRNEVAVGMFVIFGSVMLSTMLFFVSGVYLFRPGYNVNVIYDYVDILDKGAPVRMAGVRVGEVSRVDFTTDPKSGRLLVNVKLFIEQGVEIKQSYVFEIRGAHILSEPHIEITPQPGEAPLLADGAVIQGKSFQAIEKLIERAHDISGYLEEVVKNLRDALRDQETAASLKAIVVNLADLTKSMQQVLDGSEAEFKEAITNINTSSRALQSLLDRLDKGEGTVGKLLKSDELYQDMRAFVAEIKARPWRLLKSDDKKRRFLIV